MIASAHRVTNGILLLALLSFLTSCQESGQGQADAAVAASGVQVHRVVGTVTLDGQLNEPAWQNAPVIPLAWEKVWKRDANKKRFASLEKTEKPVSWAKLLWDEKHIYFACWCEDKDLLATYTERDAELWREDAMEIFFRPRQDSTRYWEYEWSPKNVLLDIAWPEEGKRDFKRDKQWNGKSVSAVRARGTIGKHGDEDQGWTLEVRIPFTDFAASVRTAPKVGDEWHATIVHYSKWMDGKKKRVRTFMVQPIMLTNQVDQYFPIVFAE